MKSENNKAPQSGGPWWPLWGLRPFLWVEKSLAGVWTEWHICKRPFRLLCYQTECRVIRNTETHQEANAGIQKRENNCLHRKLSENWQSLAIYYFCTLTRTLVPNTTITVSTNSKYFQGELYISRLCNA